MLNGLKLVAIAFLVVASGCSGGGEPISPGDVVDMQVTSGASQSAHILWGIWGISLNSEDLKVVVEPRREALAHFDVTGWLLPPLCDDCLKVTVNSFNPITRILDADVTLRNPTNLDARDIRGILYSNEFGHELRNADDWTGLFDVPGGDDINPFKAFATSAQNRIFAAGVEHTVNYLIYIPMPPHYDGITFAVDASWPGNCREPYAIADFSQEPILEGPGSTGNVQVDVYDWQDDVSEVLLSVPEITGDEFTSMVNSGGTTWVAELTNNENVPQGGYPGLITARSSNSGDTALYDHVTIYIYETGAPINPVEVTPPWLNFTPLNICKEGNYAYIASGDYGLHIFDISDPTNPVWLNKVDLGHAAFELTVVDGYVYVIYLYYGLTIVDVDPPETAHVVGSIELPGIPVDVAVSEGYAYVTRHDLPLAVIDVDPPESAWVVTDNCYTSELNAEIVAMGDYAFAATYHVFMVIDISDPATTTEVATMDLPKGASSIEISGDYVYIVNDIGPETLCIVNIEEPESPVIVNTFGTGDQYQRLVESDGYLYVAGGFTFDIYDVDPPESAFLVSSMIPPGSYPQGIVLNGDYAHYIDGYTGLHTVDISQPESVEMVDSIYCLRLGFSIEVSGDYCGAWDELAGLFIVDVSSPESAYFRNMYLTEDQTFRFGMVDGYAFLPDGSKGMSVLDIDPPENAEIVHVVDTLFDVDYVFLSDDIAYATGGGNIGIIDVSVPESAYLLDTADILTTPMLVSDGYAYAYSNYEFFIYDIDPPETAYLAETIHLDAWLHTVEVKDGLVYGIIGDPFYQARTLIIMDVDPPESTYVISETVINDSCNEMAISGGYAYILGDTKMYVMDIDPPESVHIVTTIEGGGGLIAIQDNYAYVTDWGLRIFKLW